jgi:ubiquinone/menaquinone biosynthesis C-methylase UbiE
LVARAVELESAAPRGITYLQMDASQIGTRFAPEDFDLVTGCMALQDMGDPAAVLAGAARVLRRDGRAVFSVPHPCTDPPVREWQRGPHGEKLALCLDRYFDTGPAVCHWSMPRLKYPWHTPFRRFTLSEWSRMIAGAGFFIHSLTEPRPDADLVAAHPQLEDCSRMPYFLIFDLRKSPA